MYGTTHPNESIHLYSGDVSIEMSGVSVKGSGMIKLRWLPSPRLLLSFEGVATKDLPKHGKMLVSAPEIGLRSRGLSTGISMKLARPPGVPVTVSGVLLGRPTVRRAQGRQRSMRFHLSNFPDLFGSKDPDSPDPEQRRHGRVVMDAGPWRVSLESVRNIRKLIESLRTTGGHAITHTGQLERRDGRTFSDATADSVGSALFYTLSFARGAWCGPMLFLHRDAAEQTLREDWRVPKTDPWSSSSTWFDEMHADSLQAVFNEVFGLWSDSTWRDTLTLAISMFVDANRNASPEVSLLTSQAALELLAWVILVEKGPLSRRSFEAIPGRAAGRIGALLRYCQIPTAIPSALHNLRSFARRHGWKSGAATIVGIRNGIVHPTKRKRSFSSSAIQRYEARQLTSWYVELVILHTLCYRGQYRNRLRARWVGVVEKVPWA
jgi:hypothetical protein